MRGTCCRRFIFGSRSVPPARAIAFSPSPSKMRVASATVRGDRNSNNGKRIMIGSPSLSLGVPWHGAIFHWSRSRPRLPTVEEPTTLRPIPRSESVRARSAGHGRPFFPPTPSEFFPEWSAIHPRERPQRHTPHLRSAESPEAGALVPLPLRHTGPADRVLPPVLLLRP